jgi:hypothetical protein
VTHLWPERLSQSKYAPRIVLTEAGCWQWIGSRSGGSHPYGRVRVAGATRTTGAHRAVYEELVGPIPSGKELDHLCRNTLCVNPAHLEPVSHRTNMLRGQTVNAENARKTHCPRGHLYDRVTHDRQGRPQRECHRCRKVRMAAYKARKQAAA